MPIISVRFSASEAAYYLSDDSTHPGIINRLTNYLDNYCYNSLFTPIDPEIKVLEAHLPRFIDTIDRFDLATEIVFALRKAFWHAHRSTSLPRAPFIDVCNFTPLYHAITQQNFAGAMALLDEGRAINSPSVIQGDESIVTAIVKDPETQPESIIFLLEQGAMPDFEPNKKYILYTALEFAIWYQQRTSAKLLLLHGAQLRDLRSIAYLMAKYAQSAPETYEQIRQAINIAQKLRQYLASADQACTERDYAKASEAFEAAAKQVAALARDEDNVKVLQHLHTQELNLLFKALNCQERLAEAANGDYQYLLLNQLLILSQQLAEPVYKLECLKKAEQLLINPLTSIATKENLQTLCLHGYTALCAQAPIEQARKYGQFLTAFAERFLSSETSITNTNTPIETEQTQDENASAAETSQLRQRLRAQVTDEERQPLLSFFARADNQNSDASAATSSSAFNKSNS